MTLSRVGCTDARKDRDVHDDLERGDVAIERFLAVVAHELRSPLNGIQSWTHVLEAQLPPAPALQRALAGIRTGVEQQVRLLDALSDAAHVLGNAVHLERRVFVLRPVVESACKATSALADERTLQLAVDLRIGVERVRGDDGRVRQMLDLLLADALRRSDPGGVVRVSTCVLGPVGAGAPSRVRITVCDAGRGLQGGLPEGLFEPFRAHPARGGGGGSGDMLRATGIGLELAVVRRLARLHGGDVTCQEIGTGQGTAFHITLPLHADEAPPGA